MSPTTMLTAHGARVDLALPALHHGEITLSVIAHHLAQINRFTGAARRPYSVAEHSLLVADIADRELRLDVHGQFAALLHDAHEAFVGDASTPMKHALGGAWHLVEEAWQRATLRAFGVLTPSAAYRSAIKRADLMALAIERRDLMPAGDEWPILHGVPVLDYLDVRGRERMTWADWRDAFSARADELDYARTTALHLSRHEAV